MLVNLREWALAQGVHPVTAYRWFREGKLPVPARRAGRLILVNPEPVPASSGRVVAYCRVSSADQNDDLEHQIGRVVTGAAERGLTVDQVVTEVGSRMDGNRHKLTKVLSDPAVSMLVVERRDRLIGFGFEYLAASMAACGRRIVVLDEAETSEDLVRDVTEVLTALFARRYGRRSASRRAAKAVAVATGEVPG